MEILAWLRRLRGWILVALGIGVVLTGCRDGSQRDVIRVGVLVPTSAGQIAVAMRRGIETTAKVLGVRVAWRDETTSDPRLKPTEQELLNAIELLEKERVRALVYTPLDLSTAAAVLRQAQKANVPVVCLDALPPNINVGAYVGTDYVAAGEQTASAALERVISLRRANVENEFHALVIEGSWQNDAERDIVTGFYRRLDENPAVRVVGRASVESPTDAFRFTSTLLNNYAGNVQLLLIADTRYVSGAILATKTRGLAEWTISAGVGAGEEACRLILEGVHDIELDLMPEQRAVRALQVAADLALRRPLTPDALIHSGAIRVPAFYGSHRVISRENLILMRELWKNLYVP